MTLFSSMNPLFTLKIEEPDHLETSFKVKQEECFKVTHLPQFIIREGTTMSEFENPFYIHLCHSQETNKSFDDLIKGLEAYLQAFVDVEDFLLPPSCSDQENEEIIEEAKSQFKKLGTEIIKALGEDIKGKGVPHTLPESYMAQLAENTKRRIFNSYKNLKKNLVEALTFDKKDSSSTKESSTRPKKIIRKQKCNFPAKAQVLLKSWFTLHYHDPYPSHEEKIQLATKGGISMKQLENWLTNTRGRVWKKNKKSEPKFAKKVAHVLKTKNEDFLNIPF